MVKKVSVVIGANWGDEGKGLVTDRLCCEYSSSGSVLNVLTNGGCQRGHTVMHNDKRTVFSHLGSGFFYADSYFSEFYMVNPMIFCKEYDKFLSDNLNEPSVTFRRVFVDPDCVITTPYDMLVNRMIVNRKSETNSCGYGIWETKVRTEQMPALNFCKWRFLVLLDREELLEIILKIRTYSLDRLASYGVKMTDAEKDLFFSDILLNNYVDDCMRMMKITTVAPFNYLFGMYDYVVFENAQGLLLDMDINPEGTPSNTGMKYVNIILDKLGTKDFSVTPYYVTRSYLTKHGSGDFREECMKKEINPDMVDLTNVPNDYQGILRYGKFDDQSIVDLITRIGEDAKDISWKLVVTHWNEYQEERLREFADFISCAEDDFGLMQQKQENFRHLY